MPLKSKRRTTATTTDLGNWHNGKLVLYFGPEASGLANPKIGFNLVSNPLLRGNVSCHNNERSQKQTTKKEIEKENTINNHNFCQHKYLFAKYLRFFWFI